MLPVVLCTAYCLLSFSCKKSMKEPLMRLSCSIMSQSEKPVPLTLLIFHHIIIAVLSVTDPPFGFNAFRPVCFFDGMQLASMPEMHRRVIRDGCCHFYRLGHRQ